MPAGPDAPPTIPPGPAAPDASLDGEPWVHIRAAWDRRDNRPFRAHVHDLLDDHMDPPPPRADGTEPPPSEPLLVWRRLSQSYFTGRHERLVELFPEEVRGEVVGSDGNLVWARVVPATLDILVAPLADAPPDDAVRALATITVWLYFECLVFWEHSGEYEPIEAIVAALSSLSPATAPQVGAGAAPDLVLEADAVHRAASLLAASLRSQFDVEEGSGSCCPVKMGKSAGRAAKRLGAAERQLDSITRGRPAAEASPNGHGAPVDVTDPALVPLVTLMERDAAHTHPYYALIRDQVAPASFRFESNLFERDDDRGVEGALAHAIEACRQFEASESGRHGVFGSEARAHRSALEAALASVHSSEPSLLMGAGEVVFVYPFGLPVATAGSDAVRQALRDHFGGHAGWHADEALKLAGLPVALDDTPQTNAWEGSGHKEGLDSIGVRLLFPQHELVYQTSDGRVYRDLGIEVRLGGLGNHYVRISIDPATPLEAPDLDADADADADDEADAEDEPGAETGADPDRTEDGDTREGSDPTMERWPLTAHDLDQLVRRAGLDHGPDRVWLQPHAAEGHERPAGPPEGADPATVLATPRCYDQLLDLAVHIVEGLVAYAKKLADKPGVDKKKLGTDFGHDTTDAITEFLQRHAHVLTIVTEATAVGAGSEVRLEHPAELFRTAGAQVLTTGQRPYSQSPLEWVRFPRPEPGDPVLDLEGKRIRDELVACSGDTTLVFAPTLPHWQLMETLDLVEFACSLSGVYDRRRAWMRQVFDEAEERSAAASQAAVLEHDDDRLPVLHHNEEELRHIELELGENINHVEALIDRARSVHLSRDPQSRTLLDHLNERNGVADLQDALVQSLQASATLQRSVHTRVEQLSSHIDKLTAERAEDIRKRRERPLEILGAILGLTGILSIIDWFAGHVGLGDNNRVIFGVELVLMVLLAVVVVLVRFRNAKPDQVSPKGPPDSGPAGGSAPAPPGTS